jgi:filamentous hemagglutinin family protein
MRIILLATCFILLFEISCPVVIAQVITSSGLNTAVSAPILLANGQTQFNITGGTRPSGGANLFHSFGNFSVPNNNIANFLNETSLPTSNILGRVTGGNISNILGTVQTTGFANANLYLMNPAGFLFGPNATLNVGGMVALTSADYLRLADNARFNVVAGPTDAVLTAAPVAAFGFLGSNPGAITVQGSQLTVAEGTGISLVGGNITVQGGTLTAPSGPINLVSVGRPSNPEMGGEVVIAGTGPGPGFNPTGFQKLGTITLTQGSKVDTSSAFTGGLDLHAAGDVLIRGGQFVMADSSIGADGDSGGGNVDVTADQIALSNGVLGTSTSFGGPNGDITFNAKTFSATDSTVSATRIFSLAGGAVTIQGFQGAGTNAHTVFLGNTQIFTIAGLGVGGPITIYSDNISLNHAALNSLGTAQAGPITLTSRAGLDILDSLLSASGGPTGNGGTVDLRAGSAISLNGTTIDASGDAVGGSATMAAPIISLGGSTVDVSSFIGFPGSSGGGTITITGKNAVSLTNGTVLNADGLALNGGAVLINGGARFTSQQSTISTQGRNGGTIQVNAKIIELTDSQLKASTSGGPGSVGGTITMDAKSTTLTNSQILSTATEGQGGTISITSPRFNQDASSVIDASSQSGTDGTVTINGVVQP